jgi:hypothetical protein
LQKDDSAQHTPWQALKLDSGRPTLNHLRELVKHLQWPQNMIMQPPMFENIPDAKLRHFAAEAKSLDAARMREMEASKRYALCAALIKMQTARRLDDLAIMFIKRMKRTHNKAQEALDAYRKEYQGRVDKLLSILQELLTVLERPGTPEEKLATMKSIVGERQQELIEECKAYAAYADNNYAPFLWKYFKSHRQALFNLLEHVTLVGTSQDHSTEEALEFVRQHRHSKADWLDASSLDLSRVPDKWWKLICGKTSKTKSVSQVARRHFEVCVFSQLVFELKSSDLCIVGSDDFSDYRNQLIS